MKIKKYNLHETSELLNLSQKTVIKYIKVFHEYIDLKIRSDKDYAFTEKDIQKLERIKYLLKKPCYKDILNILSKENKISNKLGVSGLILSGMSLTLSSYDFIIKQLHKDKQYEVLNKVSSQLIKLLDFIDELKKEEYLSGDQAHKIILEEMGIPPFKPNLKLKNKFRIVNDQLIFDSSTKLLWMRILSDKKMGYRDALLYVKNLNANEYQNKNTWRLPSFEEGIFFLYRIHKAGMTNELTNIHEYVWTANKSSSWSAWSISLGSTASFPIISYPNGVEGKCYVRAVTYQNEY
jgi:hypothetical protein